MSSFIYFCLSMILIESATASEFELLVSNSDGFRHDVHNYLVMLQTSVYDSQKIFVCSGSIIDKEWIITAAHCFPHDTRAIKIIQQQHYRNRVIGYGGDYVNNPYYIDIPIFFHDNAENDVALVRTVKPIIFNAYTQPIALARLCAWGQQGTIAGYGESEFGSGIPLEGAVVVMPCRAAPSDTNMLCSQSKAYANQGDSGGALKTDDGLVGVVCGTYSTGKQTLFVNISAHFNWIQQVMGKQLHMVGMNQEIIE